MNANKKETFWTGGLFFILYVQLSQILKMFLFY